MSGQEEALRQVLMQLQDQHTAASRALATVRAQAEAKERQRRIAEITLGEISAVPDNDGSKLYRGVGKMFVLATPVSVKSELRADLKSATEDAEAMRKKAKYLEGEIAAAERNLREIAHGRRMAD